MNFNWREIKVVAVAAFMLAQGTAFAQKDVNTKTYIPKKNNGLEIPLDPNIKKGVLPNGFTYFILKNTEPKDRMVMFLANKVGSILETDQQQGLAHFLEHMNFNGTTHFPKNELINYLQLSGVRFGADLNAYTAFDQTVYQLPIPSNNPELLQQGLLIMRDWAHGALLESEEIDQERGVILEEKRQSTGLSSRIQDSLFPILMNNSRYAKRSPIGTEEVLVNFDHKEIRDFYNNWYRPELQALIVVGDIDQDAIEKEVIRLFSDLQNPKDAPKRNYYKIKLTGKNQFYKFTDPEVSSVALEINYKAPVFRVKKASDYKTAMQRSLFTQLLNARLRELTQKNSTPFLTAAFNSASIYGDLEMRSISVTPKPGKLKESVLAAYEAFRQVVLYGFTQGELDRAKANYIASLEQSKAEESKRESQSYVDDILGYYLEGKPAAAFDYVYPILRKNIEEVSLKDIQKYSSLYKDAKNRDIIALSPKNRTDEIPDEKTIESWIKQGHKLMPEPYKEEVVQAELVKSLPAAGSIVSREKNDKIGTTTLTLSNGVKVILKDTDFKNDEILISSYSAGGLSLYDVKDFQSAVNATSIVRSSGVSDFNAIQLSRFLAGKKVSVAPKISELSEGINATAVHKDLKTAFELIYAYFTSPRLDKEINQEAIEKSKIALENRYSNVQAFFQDSVSRVLFNNDPRKTGPSIEKLDQIDLDRAFEIYKDRFADASDFTFVIVGNFDEKEMEAYLTQYIATLPSTGRKENYVDNATYPPAQGFELDIHKGTDDKATVMLSFMGDYDYNSKDNMLFQALAECLNVKLLQRLREQESGIYSISVDPSMSKEPRGRFVVNIPFTTDPKNAEHLMDAAWQEIEKIKAEGPAQEDIDKFIAEKLLNNKSSLVSNQFWLSYLLTSAIREIDPTSILTMDERVKAVNREDVQKLAQKYLTKDRLFKFVLYPEK